MLLRRFFLTLLVVAGLMIPAIGQDKDKPPADKPPADKPPAGKPAADKPTADKPPADKPTADKPAADKPTADKPAADKPPADKPAADKPPADKPPAADKPSADTATLKWKFEKGKTFYQTMTTKTNQNMKVMGSDIKQDQSQTFWFSWTPEEDKDGKWAIKQKIEGVQMSIDIGGSKISIDSTQPAPLSSPLGEFVKALVGSEFKIILTKDFKVEKIEGRKEFLDKLIQSNPPMKGLLEQILSEEAIKEMADPTFAVLPNEPKKVDDKWERKSNIKMGPIGSYNNVYTYTYKGKDGKLDKIDVKTALTYSPPDPAAAAGGAMPFKIKSAKLESKNASGTIWVDADKGRVDHSDMKLELSGNLSIEINGQTADVTLTQEQSTNVKTTDELPFKKPS